MNQHHKIASIAYLSSGLFAASQALLFVMYPILSESLHLSLSQVVSCFTIGSFLFLWGGPYWAMKSDHVGRRAILLLGQSAVFISILVLALLLGQWVSLSPSLCLVVLFSSRILYGAVGSALVPVAQALVLDEGDFKSRTKAITTNSMFLNLGRVVGPIVGLSLVSVSASYLTYVFLAFFLALMILTRLWIRRDEQKSEGSLRSSFRFRNIWPDRRETQSIVLLAFLTTSFLGIFQSSLGGFLQARYGWNAAQSSHLMAKLLIAGAGVTVAIQALSRWKLSGPWQGSLPLGMGSLALGALILLTSQGTVPLYASIAMMSMGVALLTPAYTSIMSLTFKNEQGRAAGSLSAAHTLGYSFGGLMSAFVMTWGSKMPFYVALALGLIMMAMLPALYRNRPELELA